MDIYDSKTEEINERKFAWKESPNQEKFKLIDRYISKGRVLDIATGAGWYSRYLAKNGCDVIAIDINPASLYNLKLVDFLKITCEFDLPFANDSFDYVICYDIIEHIENETNFLSEIKRILKQDGYILVSVPNGDDSQLIGNGLTYIHFKDRSHKRNYLPSTLRKIFADEGFVCDILYFHGGEGYPYLLTNFIHNCIIKDLARVLIWILVRVKIVQINNCQGDIFGAFKNGKI